MTQPPKPPLSLRVPDDLQERVLAWATDHGLSRSAAYVALVELGLGALDGGAGRASDSIQVGHPQPAQVTLPKDPPAQKRGRSLFGSRLDKTYLKGKAAR